MKVRYTIHEKSKMIGAVDEVDDRVGNRLIATNCAVLVTEEELATEAMAAAAEAKALEVTAEPIAPPSAAEPEGETAAKPAQKPAPKSAK